MKKQPAPAKKHWLLRCFTLHPCRCWLSLYIVLIVVFACVYSCLQCCNPHAFYIPASLTQDQKCSAFRKEVKDKTLCELSAQNISDFTLLRLMDEVAAQPPGATVAFEVNHNGQLNAQVPADSPSPSNITTNMITITDSASTLDTYDNKIIMWAGDDRASHPLGNAWAAYYTELLLTNGYDVYSITSSQEVPALVRYGESRFPLAKYQLLMVKVKNRDPDMKDLTLALFFDFNAFHALWPTDPSTPDTHDTTVRDFYNILPHCLNHLDDAWEAIETSLNPPIGFCDFLYFSIITITTTGYGDILPNTTYVRCLVSLEILLGTIIFGLFLGSLTDKVLRAKGNDS